MLRTLAFGENLNLAATGAGGRATLSLHTAGDEAGLHEHADGYVRILLWGALEDVTATGVSEFRAGQRSRHRSGDRHANRIGAAGALCLNLHGAADVDGWTDGPLDVGGRIAAHELAWALVREAPRQEVEALSAELEAVGAAPRPDPQAVYRAMEALAAGGSESLGLERLALLCDRHPTHLARAFRRATGLSIGAWSRRLRLTRAAGALRASRASIAEIAAQHGFADQAHLCRDFRRAFGCPPSAWRAR
ncbi:AraC family transcriptional regulator [Brevundimonas sp. 2R-24]|uniref:AraC family transcriptional regulator n=1 Tax=Peiella sedimenti TaxID=3061083 RepID=A0ABT8SIH0_9CAUL|nr:AraC family transcriptional regulator [Caulobacteraceae bacterium XZ-24]